MSLGFNKCFGEERQFSIPVSAFEDTLIEQYAYQFNHKEFLNSAYHQLRSAKLLELDDANQLVATRPIYNLNCFITMWVHENKLYLSFGTVVLALILFKVISSLKSREQMLEAQSIYEDILESLKGGPIAEVYIKEYHLAEKQHLFSMLEHIAKSSGKISILKKLSGGEQAVFWELK